MGVSITQVIVGGLGSLFGDRPILKLAMLVSLFYALLSFSLLAALFPSPLSSALPILGIATLGLLVVSLINSFMSAVIANPLTPQKMKVKQIQNAMNTYFTLFSNALVLGVIFITLLLTTVRLDTALLTILPVGLVLLLAVAAFLMIYFVVRLLVAVITSFFLRKGVLESVRSSLASMRTNFWGLIAIALVLGIAAGIEGAVASVLLALAGTAAVGAFFASFVQYAIIVSTVYIYQGFPSKR